jgi:hypothetical protein
MNGNKAVTATFTANTGSSGGFGGGGGGGGAVVPPGYTNLTPYTNGLGYFNLDVTIISDDGMARLLIEKGTTCLEKNGSSLKSAGIFRMKNALVPPSGYRLIGASYDFLPDGATLTPSAVLTIKYVPGSLPTGISASGLRIARWDGSTWTIIDSRLDSRNEEVIARITGFSQYAVIGKEVAVTVVPAKFSLSSITVTPAASYAGDDIVLSASVKNDGGSTGKHTVVLKINGTKTDSAVVDLAPGSATTVTFILKQLAAGQYSYDLNGSTGSFTVKERPVSTTVPPTTEPEVTGGEENGLPWWVFGAFFGAIVLGGGVTLALRSLRRRPGQP